VGLVRRHPLLAAAAAAVVLLLGILALTGFAVWQAAHTDDASRVDHADLIAVLGAAQYNGDPSPVFRGRLQHAALLYREGFAPMIAVLGAGRPGDITTEAESGQDWLVDEQGLPREAVAAIPLGGTTIDSLRAAAAFMRQRHLTTVFLVSDPWHNLRIRRMGNDLGMRAYVSATFHSAARSQWTRMAGYTRETFAYIYYRLFGR
jgi:uncharacterized SAM-binding protein YcdF (DUF218 family)